MIPADRLYTKNHEWARLVDSMVEVGVTRPLLRKIGPLVSVELPDADDEMKLELPFGELESLNEVYQLYPPIETRIVEVNEELIWNHTKLLKDPYGDGWLLKIRVNDPAELNKLFTPAVYEKYCRDVLGEEFLRG